MSAHLAHIRDCQPTATSYCFSASSFSARSISFSVTFSCSACHSSSDSFPTCSCSFTFSSTYSFPACSCSFSFSFTSACHSTTNPTNPYYSTQPCSRS